MTAWTRKKKGSDPDQEHPVMKVIHHDIKNSDDLTDNLKESGH